MKKIITFTTICIIASIVLSSCKSGTSIMKRRYSKGYYVSHNKGKHTTPILKAEEKVALLNQKDPEFLTQEKDQDIVLKQSVNKSSKVNVITANNEKKTESKNNFSRSSSLKFTKITINKSLSQINKTIYNINKKSNIDGERDGLSLFWVIILILLILWALGFALAVGDIVYLLLVAALILFVLWLLRIV